MDGPPPFEDCELAEERPGIFSLDDEEPPDNSLPDNEYEPETLTIASSSYTTDVKVAITSNSSIPEFTTDWEDTVPKNKERSTPPVKKAQPCNGHMDTLSGISEATFEQTSELKDVNAVPEISNNVIVPEQEEPQQSTVSCEVEAQQDDDDDDFGDFADFTAASSSQLPMANEETTQDSMFVSNETAFKAVTEVDTNSEELNQEWASFAELSTIKVAAGRFSDDEWGDFGKSDPPANVTSGKRLTSRASINDDDWDEADFVSAPVSTTVADFQEPQVILPKIDDSKFSSTIFDDLLLDEDENVSRENEVEDKNVFSIRDNLDKEETESLVSELVSRCTEIWLALRIVENAISLHHQFPDSVLESAFHRALHVDKKIVRGRGGASQVLADTVLMPTPISEQNRGGRPVTFSASSCSVSTAPTITGFREPLKDPSVLSSTSSTKAGTSSNMQRNWFSRRSLRFWSNSASEIVNVSDSPGRKTRSKSSSPPALTPTDSLAVPPADFNWADSGLTNPLKTKGAVPSTTLLDVDFFDPKGPVTSVSSATTLERDLDEFGLSSLAGPSKNGPAMMQQTGGMLSSLLGGVNLGGASVPGRPPPPLPVSELSLDARALHDQLPDIEYLRSRILLFPIGGLSNQQHNNTPKK